MYSYNNLIQCTSPKNIPDTHLCCCFSACAHTGMRVARATSSGERIFLSLSLERTPLDFIQMGCKLSIDVSKHGIIHADTPTLIQMVLIIFQSAGAFAYWLIRTAFGTWWGKSGWNSTPFVFSPWTLHRFGLNKNEHRASVRRVAGRIGAFCQFLWLWVSVSCSLVLYALFLHRCNFYHYVDTLFWHVCGEK